MSNTNVEVRIIKSRKEYAFRDANDEARVAEVIRGQVLPRSDADYHRVDVKVRRGPDQLPRYLVAYLLRKDVYLAEVVKVDVGPDYRVQETSWGYDDSAEADEEPAADFSLGEDEYACPYDLVAGTPVDDIASAKDAVEHVCASATAAGLKCKLLLGAEATGAAYKAYLACGLKGFVNVGHGNTGGIVLADGPLNSAWFNGVANRAVKPAVVYFNSCQVHNEPLKGAVMAAGTRTFIGGIVNLLIGASEEVCKAFWDRALSTSKGMDDILRECEKDKYPAEGAHGISGDQGAASLMSASLDHAMWVHGQSMLVEYPERLEMQRRTGFSSLVKGKPFTSNWFHFAVPTPVIAGAQRLRIGSVMIRLRTGPGARVTSVHVFDGETRLVAHDNLNVASEAFITPRFDVPTHPLVRWGVGISIGVAFGDNANLPANRLQMECSAAGGDFGFRVFDPSGFERLMGTVEEPALAAVTR